VFTPYTNHLRAVKEKKKTDVVLTVIRIINTVKLHLFGLIGTASHPDMQKIRISGFFFENRLHWQFEVLLLIFIACTCT